MNYTTSFPNTENPISEGGNWSNTVSATWTFPVFTTGGAPGTADATGASSFNDGVTLKSGTWGRAQDVTTTTSISGTPVGNPEVENHLHMTMTPGAPDQITTYEDDRVWNVDKWSVNIARWDGAQGNFALIGGGNVLVAPLDGDTHRMTDDGAGNFTTYLNGTPTGFNAGPDTTYIGGNPGLGLDNCDGHVRVKGYTATDGLSSSVPPVGRFVAPVLLW